VDDLHFCNDAANVADLFLLAVAEIKDADYHKVFNRQLLGLHYPAQVIFERIALFQLFKTGRREA
jgi:hypothetical protein